MPGPDRLTISIIIPVHKGGEAFRRCLSGLVEARPPGDEIIVVADGDTGGDAELAKSYGARVIRLSTRGGPARARNRGAEIARGDILFLLDADVLVAPDTVGRVAAILESEPDLAAVIGSYDDAPGETNFLSQYKNLFHHYVHQTSREEAATFWGACGAIRRDIFTELGGFDVDYNRPTIEDIEFGYRLRRAGHRIWLCKTLQVKHLKRWGAVSLARTDFFSRALPWTELILRDRQFTNDLNLQTESRLSVVLTYGLLAAFIAAFWWPGFLGVAAAAAGLLLALNSALYRFFLRKRGLWFALRTIPWHWFYFGYGGLAFALGTLRHLIRSRWPPRPSQPAAPGEPNG